ncbi:FtsX-like permease family protein [Leptospira ryugenii]|uniref:FtsX-like permease family protein n=1 Tax=Leptospira ryugenii TaxID=1917863 RepID=UPI000D59865D|nr:FtsX-like permease family protein [Leptospira ryugenii]
MSLTSLTLIIVCKNEEQEEDVPEVKSLSYISFAWKILIRDRLFSLVYGVSGMVLSGFFFLAIRVHIHLYGGLSISNIVSFDQTPQILFYSSFFGLSCLVLFQCVERLGDIGVMMAVGGNRWGCIWLQSLVLVLLVIPASVLGFFLSQIVAPPATWTLSSEIYSFFLGTAILILLCFGVSIPSIGLTTFVDPYRAIRRQR